MKKVIAILGSSRSRGNTRLLLDTVMQTCPVRIIDIAEQRISTFDYSNQNQSDDFLSIASELTAASGIIFATPVYWYAMSAQMKTFFDRFSDLITIRKDLGRALGGKPTFLIATGTEPEMPSGFEIPFERTSKYLNMEFKGSFYQPFEKELFLSNSSKTYIQDFAKKILDLTSINAV